RAVTLTRFDELTVDDFPEKVRSYRNTPSGILDLDDEHPLQLHELERRYIERVLKAAQGNKTQAAKLLGLDRRTLYRKLERYEQEEKGRAEA
ncbi:MAG: helix-turn-helix domain-containing protein, partial [Myxococcales bacterium]|nr:helix-turn-helix domain-containing protein [Myxococcales bacterium]